jgi:hypothetical protein
MNFNHLFGSCVLAAAALLPVGAPIPALAAGIAMAALLSFTVSRIRTADSTKIRQLKKRKS